jgi:hypothetical protein
VFKDFYRELPNFAICFKGIWKLERIGWKSLFSCSLTLPPNLLINLSTDALVLKYSTEPIHSSASLLESTIKTKSFDSSLVSFSLLYSLHYI